MYNTLSSYVECSLARQFTYPNGNQSEPIQQKHNNFRSQNVYRIGHLFSPALFPTGRLCEEEGLQVLVLQEADRAEGWAEHGAEVKSHGKRFSSGLLQMRGEQ